MPRAPAPDEDDELDDLPDTHPTQPVHDAEQALLGALLLEPHRLLELTAIKPDSFSQPAHGALFAAIRTLPAPGPGQHTKDTSWLNAVLAAVREDTRGLTASYLHTLVRVCPWPRHASAYARMVEARTETSEYQKLRSRFSPLHTSGGDRTPLPGHLRDSTRPRRPSPPGWKRSGVR